jgi:hypothetical protein
VRAAEELARLNKPMSGDGAPRSSQEEELGRPSKSAGRAGLDGEEHSRTASGENPGAGARQSSQPPGAVGPYFSTEASTSRGWGSANANVNSRTVSRSGSVGSWQLMGDGVEVRDGRDGWANANAVSVGDLGREVTGSTRSGGGRHRRKPSR